MSRIVIALGGNALGNTPKEQQERIDNAAPALIGLIKQGHEIIISHGNGPQVGIIRQAFDTASAVDGKVPAFELPECTAMSQGYIGFHLQKGIKKELRREGMPWHVATVVTQIVVDKEDPAFLNPTKPIGSFYPEDEALKMMAENPGLCMKEDAGRGYRQMVASPKPMDIAEKDSILNLLDENGDYESVPAVIDKDFASARLAELVDADYLFILTAVDRVAVNYGKPDQRELREITVQEAERLCSQGHFAPGSMLPKVEAAMEFARGKKGRKSVIASLEKAPLAMIGESGTRIVLG